MGHQTSNKLLGAVDLGGTTISSALFSAAGDILDSRTETPTPVKLAPAELVERIADNFLATVEGNGCRIGSVSGLGIGVPSTIQYKKGLLDESPNLPTVKDYPLARKLAGRLGLPVTMEKDANCFLLGEMRHGAAVGCADCCGITLGTGLGLGVAIDGRLLRGSNDCAGEIWTAPYRDGILEDRVSGTALAEQYFRAGGNKLTGAEIHTRAADGEALAREIFAQMGEALGFGLAYLVNVLNPEIVVVGGSVARAWDFFAGPMHKTVDKYKVKRNTTKIVTSKLGNLSCLYGAIALPYLRVLED
ncbi:MAG: ROK family protein [Candidatus Glassbacteria bacterium]|nr:ROK family protein [Candidatus Glassbacteria bacterium]